MRVHQLLAALSYGDAIGNEALAIQRQLRAAGHESDIFAELVHPRVAHLARPLWEYREVSSPDTVCIFHFSIGSAAGRLIHHAPDRLVIVYHNITPAHFFLGFHPHLAGLCHHGRRELEAFAPRTELALGDSEFNRARARGGRVRADGRPAHRPRPLALRPAALAGRAAASTTTAERTSSSWAASSRTRGSTTSSARFAVFQKWLRPRSRLLLVGDHRGFERYLDRLQELVRELRLDEVVFTGQVDDDELYAYYRLADVFLCLSEHEGFCVPLQEAMHFGLPVIAYDAGAVRETLRGGGLLLQDKRPELVADLLDRAHPRGRPAAGGARQPGARRSRGSARPTSARCCGRG